jgi:hypothetical protein
MIDETEPLPKLYSDRYSIPTTGKKGKRERQQSE